MGTDWKHYLDRYHERNAGITEDLLDHSTHSDGIGPYDFLARQIPASSATILDVACGSAPTARRVGHDVEYIGSDRSRGELSVAATRYPDRLFVQADATAIPVTNSRVDTVVCSMALMLLDPLDVALRQIAGALRPGGSLVAMYPAFGLPRLREIPAVLAMLTALRSAPEFPRHLSKSRVTSAFDRVGLHLDSYATRRYAIPIKAAADADRLVSGLYLPHVPPERIEAARSALARLARRGTSLPMHITHIAATATATAT